MSEKRTRSIDFVMNEEGGEVSSSPGDSGGWSCWGISEKYDSAEFREVMGWDPFLALKSDLTPIPRHEAVTFYERVDWKRLRCEEIEWPLCLALLDYATHSGRSQAVRDLQSIVRVESDGIFGPITMKELGAAVRHKGPYAVASYLNDVRLQLLCKLVLKPHLQTFTLGWMRRMVRLEYQCHPLSLLSPPQTAPPT